MRIPRWVLLSFAALVFPPRVLAQSAMPELRFADPLGFYRSASFPPADFSSQEVNASLQVYPFRPFRGDGQQVFARTLLRDFIDARYQESNVAQGAKLDMISIPGARTVLRARFNEIVAGQPRERMRLAIVAGDAVAIVDAQASSLTSWQRVLPALNQFAASLRVVAGTPEAAFTAPAPRVGSAVAGLYMGFARKYMTDLQRGPAYGYSTNALLYYLFSADGRVYRHYDELKVPGNDPARFDFAAAARADPVNSGRYTVRNDSLIIRLGAGQQTEIIATRLPSAGTISLGSTSFKKQ